MMQANGLQIVTRLDSLLAEKGENRNIVCAALGLKQQTISGWYTRGSIPKADDALRIADYLGVSPWWLVFGEEKPDALSLSQASEPPISREDKKLLEEWHALTAEEQKSVRAQIAGIKVLRQEAAAEEAEAAKKA
ncbi:MAG: helix-turn-helix domain-containing protein [Treponema sp.]|nr:helix-turn-helix domain-containing protein [Treponema sp.]